MTSGDQSTSSGAASDGIGIASYRDLLERMGDCVIELILPSGRCTYCSPTCRSVFGYEAVDFLDSPSLRERLIDPENELCREPLQTRPLADRAPPIYAYAIVDPEGAKRHIQQMRVVVTDTDGKVRGVVCLCRNMSVVPSDSAYSRTTLQLASIGTFAAGIAHEINNPLNSILLAVMDTLDGRGDPGYLENVERCLEQVTEEATRCGQIVKNLLKFANEEEIDKWICNLNDVVRRSLALCVAYAAERDVELMAELALDLPGIKLNPTAIGQVVVNLVRNGVDACVGGGQVTVVTQCVADRVRLSVQDNGIGIAPQIRAHIFDPFYTTHRGDGGTGLGLSVVHGILASHSANIEVHDEEDGGTRFDVDFWR